MFFQHLCTHNDRNGNPRRLYVLCALASTTSYGANCHHPTGRTGFPASSTCKRPTDHLGASAPTIHLARITP
jgi:hypothetical protein